MPESVSRRRSPAIREIRYKGYRLRACSFERDPGMWVGGAQAFWNEGPHARIHQVFEADGERSFTIRELADERALGLAQAWVERITVKAGWPTRRAGLTLRYFGLL